jgi:hypothetical protein
MKTFALLALLGLTTVVKCDQPVHCLRQNIYGEWTFYLSTEKSAVNLFQVRDVCTHNMPNGIQVVTPNHKFAFANQTAIKVSLGDNNKAVAQVDG